ncbi:MAG: methylglutaconyl-CoA hydratase [Gaiellaceae bacterium]|nr:methylglutaconyl-CoA hydratase [Gaiellaceae bacterium]
MFQKELGNALALVDVEENAFAGRPEREHSGDPVGSEKREVGPESILVDRRTTRQERGQRGGDGSVQHGATVSWPSVSALKIERENDVLRITLARPDSRNAFDAQLISELSQAFVDVGKARAVVLAGEGASFCAGADVDWMRASAGLSVEENVADANAMRQMFESIDNCPAPVVARVQGHALGGGAGLVAAADIPISARDTVFAFSEVKLGIIPAVISPFALAKIGPGNARRYFVTGERFDPETALRIGLVTEVADDLDAAVDRVVGELLSAGPRAARWAKRLVRERPDGPETARWIAERRASDEGQEGLSAFLEKRRPAWRPK